MSRQRDANDPKRALLQKKQESPTETTHPSQMQGKQQATSGQTGRGGGGGGGGGGDEKTPLLNSMGAAAESLMNNSVVGADMQTGVSWGMAAFLLVNTALGAGMLNYPYAYNQIGGVWAAALMQVVLLVFITSTMFILVYCADFNRDDTYHDVLLSMCGKRAQQISALSIMLTCYGINITFLVIIGDQYDRIFNSLLEPDYVANNWWLDRKFTIFLTSILFIWPMCYAKRLDFLRHASVLGMFAMLYVAFLTVYEHYKLDETTIAAVLARLQASGEGGSGSGSVVATTNATTTTTSANPESNQPGAQKSVQWFEPLAVVPVLCFAYQTHEVIVPVYACMKERAIGSFMKASIFGLIILFFLYNLVGAFGYLTFGADVGADIMSLYDAKDPIVVVGVVALVIKFITTYPPLMFCGRSALDGLYAELRSLSTSEFKSHERARRYVISTLWFLTTVALAAFAPDISVTLQLLGSMASINVFVFPGMCLVSLTRRLRKARLALLMGELPDGVSAANQQRAKDFYLISGSYFGAAMKRNVALRNQYRQQQQQQQQLLCCHHRPGAAAAPGATNGQAIDYQAAAAAGAIEPGPKQFAATFASLLEFENNMAHANGSKLNGMAASSGRGTGEILSSISTPSTSSSSAALSSLADNQQSLLGGKRNSLVNGYGTAAAAAVVAGQINGRNNNHDDDDDADNHDEDREFQLQQISGQIQRRQSEFERMMMLTNSADSCACFNTNSSSNPLALTFNNRKDQQVTPMTAGLHSRRSSCGTGALLGATINHSYDDYSDYCLEHDCPNRQQQQQHLHQARQQLDKISANQQQPLLISHPQSQAQRLRLGSASGPAAGAESLPAAAIIDHLDVRPTLSSANQTAPTTNALLQQSIRQHCQNCHNHSSNQQRSLCHQNSYNYACQQSTTASLLDRFGSSIAPSTVAQVGISQCTATGLYLFAVFLIVFGVFIFILELMSVSGFL